MARLRLEYLAREARSNEAYNRWDAAPAHALGSESLKLRSEAASGAARDVEYQIFDTPIRTMADAVFVLRLFLFRNSLCMCLPHTRSPDEAAIVNAVRVLNGLACDDVSVSTYPEDADAPLSLAPYADESQASAAAAE